MKLFQKMTMKTINSVQSNFSLSIVNQTERKNQANDTLSNAYVSSARNANNDSSIYLVFEFKTQEFSSVVYASYPNMMDFRTTLRQMYEDHKNAFATIDGVPVVKPEYSDARVVDEIGQENKWVSFKFVIGETTENGMTQRFPAVQVQLSSSQGFVSILNLREFKSLVYVIEEVNLPLLNWVTGYAYLLSENNQQQSQPGYRSNSGYNGGYRQSQQSYGQQAPQRTYNNQPQYVQPQRNVTGTDGGPAYSSMKPYTNPAPVQQTEKLPPRSNGNVLVNLGNVNDIPVEENMNFDDEDEINSIFAE